MGHSLHGRLSAVTLHCWHWMKRYLLQNEGGRGPGELDGAWTGTVCMTWCLLPCMIGRNYSHEFEQLSNFTFASHPFQCFWFSVKVFSLKSWVGRGVCSRVTLAFDSLISITTWCSATQVFLCYEMCLVIRLKVKSIGQELWP
jgi:hypothetical protein